MGSSTVAETALQVLCTTVPAQKLVKYLSQKGSDPLEAKRNLTLFCYLAGEGLTPFGIGSTLNGREKVEFKGFVDFVE